jgi:hypothetical protein
LGSPDGVASVVWMSVAPAAARQPSSAADCQIDTCPATTGGALTGAADGIGQGARFDGGWPMQMQVPAPGRRGDQLAEIGEQRRNRVAQRGVLLDAQRQRGGVVGNHGPFV